MKDEGGRRSGEEKSVFPGVSLSCRPPVTLGGGGRSRTPLQENQQEQSHIESEQDFKLLRLESDLM